MIKIKTPKELGKIRYQESFIPKEEIKKEIFSNIFRILSSLFGSLVTILMFSHAYRETDFLSLIFGLMFSFFFFDLYRSIKNLYRVKIYVVCDNGLASYEYGFDNKLKNKEFFYFQPHFEYTIKKVENFWITGRYRYTYYIYCDFLDNDKVVYSLSYSCVDNELILTKREKVFFDKGILAFRKYKFKYKDYNAKGADNA